MGFFVYNKTPPIRDVRIEGEYQAHTSRPFQVPLVYQTCVR